MVRTLEHNAAANGSIDPTIDLFVATAAGILGDDRDSRRRAPVQLLARKTILADGHPTISGDPADLAKAIAACQKN